MSAYARRIWRELPEAIQAALAGRTEEALQLAGSMRLLKRTPFPIDGAHAQKDLPELALKLARRWLEAGEQGRVVLAPVLRGAAQSLEQLLIATTPRMRERADLD